MGESWERAEERRVEVRLRVLKAVGEVRVVAGRGDEMSARLRDLFERVLRGYWSLTGVGTAELLELLGLHHGGASDLDGALGGH